MIKKITIPTLLVVLLSAVFAVGALAAEEGPNPDQAAPERHRRQRYAGEVIGVNLGESTFTLRTRHAGEVTFLISEDTRFRGEVDGLEAMETGMKALVGARPTDRDLPLALFVGVSERLADLNRHAGRIIAVDPAAGSFQLETRDGEQISYLLNENTRFRGGVESIEDLAVGMAAGVGSFNQDDGAELAVVVVAGRVRERSRAAGTVTAVDLEGSSFVLETLSGAINTYQVGGDTRFESRDGSVQTLKDLQPGMKALVLSTQPEGGAALARRVLVAPHLQDTGG